MPDLTANEQLRDYLVRHQIGLLLLAAGIRQRAFEPLDETEVEVRDAIRRRLATVRGLVRPEDVRQLETLLRIIQRIRAGAWERCGEVIQDELEETTRREPEQLEEATHLIVPVILPKVSLGVLVIRAIMKRAFQGRTLGQWLAGAQSAEQAAIRAAITDGMVRKASADEISRAIVGTGRLQGTDGVLQTSRNSIRTILQTAINFFPHEARAEWIRLQKAFIGQELFVAVLDNRTTPLCRSLDGNIYPVDAGPRPPLHMNCRSQRVPLIDGKKVGWREARPWAERMLLREFSEMKGEPTADRRDDLPMSLRTEYDKWRERRVQELIGKVPLDMSYQDWLRTQPVAFQDEVLGRARGRLFRAGGLTLDKFVAPSGGQYTLADLARLHATAFKAAGLDPAAYQ